MNRVYRHFILIISIFMGYINIYAQYEYDSILRKIQTPLIEIWTTDGTEPTGTHITAPEGLWGIGLTNNEYLNGRMRISLNDITLYDSGEYIQDISGMRIKLRGNTSSYYWEKKPYKIKLSKKEDLLFRNESKYKDKDWVLLRVYDGFLTRLFTGNHLGELIGLGWEPKWEYVNLILNGDYKGDYILIESVEKEKGRIDIDDTGYIIEDDAYWWNEDVYFKGNILTHQTGYTFKYPDTDDLNDVLINNIKNYILDFEEILANNGDISSHIDIPNFAAWLLAQDILGMGDSGGTNRYLYKKDFDPSNPFNTPLQMGTLWDLDAAFNVTGGWSAVHGRSYSFYFDKLLKREDFYSYYISLWKELRNTLYDDLTQNLYDINLNKGEAINKSRHLNYIRWDDNATTLITEIDDVAKWIKERIEWIDTQLESDIVGIKHTISSEESVITTIYDLYGRKIDDIENLQKGIYIINGKKVIIK